MDKSINPSFLKLMELNPGKDLANMKQPLSVLLDGFLKNLKYKKYPEANNFSKAGIFIQNAAFIYSMNVEDLFNFVTDLNRALRSINLQPINNLQAIGIESNLSTTNEPSQTHPENNTREGSEESDEQVVSSRGRKQSRKKIEELDCDPIDIADPWTSDSIDENRQEIAETQTELCFDQDIEVETVLAQCDNFESTESFIHRDDISKDRVLDLQRREFRILGHMDNDGFFCSDFNIFDNVKSKRYNLMTVDLLEGSQLIKTIDRDQLSLASEGIDNAEIRENDLDDSEHGENLQKRLDLNNRDDGLFDIRKFLDYDNSTDKFGVSVLCLEEYAKKYQKRNAVYKYECNRAVNSDLLRLQEALGICSSSTEYLDSNKEITIDPDVQFEGTQHLYDGDWYHWPCEVESDDDQNAPGEKIPDCVPEIEESQFVPEPEKTRKTGVEDVHKNVFTKRASRWIEKHKPIIEKVSTRKKFNIREYGDKVIETITTIQKETATPVQTLEDVLGQKSFKEASKYFLSILVLANNGNVALEKPKSDQLTVNKCNIKLVSCEQHHDKLDQDITPMQKKFNKK